MSPENAMDSQTKDLRTNQIEYLFEAQMTVLNYPTIHIMQGPSSLEKMVFPGKVEWKVERKTRKGWPAAMWMNDVTAVMDS